MNAKAVRNAPSILRRTTNANLNLETLMFANDRKVKLTNYGLSRKNFKNELQLIKEDHWETLLVRFIS